MNLVLEDVLRESREQLESASVDNPALDARILICNALDIDRAEMTAQSTRTLSDEENTKIKNFIGRRYRRESVARILGEREFWSLNFGMNEFTLEPRPDSETLVETALKGLKDRSAVSILDLGTGTGCLLLALLHELPEATGLGLDFEALAVDQARANAESLNLSKRATFRISNWMDNLQDERYDLIVSNPPYIASNIIPTLMPEVRNFDPLAALDGGADGLDAYRLLIPLLPDRLKPEGFVVFEVGQGQAELVAELFRQNGFAKVTLHKDLSDIDRCVMANIA